MDYYTKVPFGLLLLTLLLESGSTVQVGVQEKNVATTTQPILYVTTPKSKTSGSYTISNVKKVRKENVNKKNTTTGAYTRPLQWTFPENFNDQIRQNSHFNLRHPVKSTVDPILSAKHDTSLTDQEYLQNLNVPATYESIVYNPDTKEATSAFSRSNFWETPELVVKDINQRDDRGNSLITTSSRLEYTPGTSQTPLNQIQYRGTFSNPYIRPTSQPVHENQNEKLRNTEEVEEEVEDGGDESEKQVDDESEELQEEEDVQENEKLQENYDDNSEEEKKVHSYPVNLDNREPFNPFENVQEPNDIYSDVLNNIGSVFNDDHSSIPSHKPSPNIKEFNPQSVNHGLLPEFEHYSYENLQQKQREEDDGENVAENEDLTEYEDDDEGKESKPIPQQKSKEEINRSPLNTIPPPKKKPEKILRESPFPSVKILNEKQEKSERLEKPRLKQENSLPFSPWLPTQAPFKYNEPTPWSHLVPKSEKPIYQTWPKVAETKQNSTYKEPIGSEKINKPYQDSYKTSYNKSWKTSSPNKDKNSTYKTTWKSTEPGKNKKDVKNPKKSSKILRQSSSNVEKVIRRMEEPRRNTSGITFFVTPVPSREFPKDNEA